MENISTNEHLNVDAFKMAIDGEKPLEHWCLPNNRALVGLAEGFSIYFKGRLELTVLRGRVECLGFEIGSEHGPTEIFSPRGYSLLCMNSISAGSNDEQQSSERNLDIHTAKEFGIKDANDAQRAIDLWSKNDRSWIIVAAFQKPWIDFVEDHLRHSKENVSLFRRDTTLPQLTKVVTPYAELEKWLDINLVAGNYENRSRLYEPNRQWDLALKSV